MTVPTGLAIRPGRAADATRLSALAIQVWLQTYASAGVTDVMAGYVLAEFAPERFVARTRDDVLWIAEVDGALAGYALATRTTTCPVATTATVELATLYVQAPFHGRGVGAALMAEAEAEAQADAGLWLTVNARNDRALAFYAGRGYRRIGATDFVLGGERHENHVLVGA